MARDEEYILPPHRVLDLTDEKGFQCGRILADLGMDVIKIERLGGDPARNIGPFVDDVSHPEKSLYWFAGNVNKRGITLNIETEDGKEIFRKLVKSAGFVIESFPPGYMRRLGLGYSALSKINPRLIMTSISPFGQNGPYKDYKGSDIVGMAMSGFMYLCGDSDRPPVRITCPQAYMHAGTDAALGTMIAHYHREMTGEGQHVDVSVQASAVPTMNNALMFWDLMKKYPRRAGSFRTGLSTSAYQRLNWPCRDGYVTYALLGAAAGARSHRALVEWMDAEGMAPDFLKAMDWNEFDVSTATQDRFELLEKPIVKFFAKHTCAELYQGAIDRGIMLYPVFNVKDIVEDPQLADREFWVKVPHPEMGVAISYPGAFAKLSEAYCGIRRRPPLIGEHNAEIYEGELGFSRGEVVALREGGTI